MTYSQAVKEELCTAKFTCDSCSFAFVYAMLLFRECDDGVLFQSDNRQIIDLLAQKIVELTGVIASPEEAGDQGRKKHKVYRLILENTEDIAEFYKTFEKGLLYQFDSRLVKKDCCKAAFLRGVFLACGVIVNPSKEYHFEFKVRRKELANNLSVFLLLTGLEFRSMMRKGNYILYLKGSEPIEEILTYMGAYKNALDLMNVKILKEVRNNVNRVTNCETANIEKTVKASMKQVSDIRYIIDHMGIEYLTEDLKVVALARLENPDMSLNELLKEIPDGISRSGLNHRLNKLMRMADELRV